jgi:hypothetical protein
MGPQKPFSFSGNAGVGAESGPLADTGDRHGSAILGATPVELVAALNNPNPETALHKLMLAQLDKGQTWGVLSAQLLTLQTTLNDEKLFYAIEDALNFLETEARAVGYSIDDPSERGRIIYKHGLWDGVLWAALGHKQPEKALHEAVLQRLNAGQDRAVVLAQMEALRAGAEFAGDESRENHILDVMDAVVGWCNPSNRL